MEPTFSKVFSIKSNSEHCSDVEVENEENNIIIEVSTIEIGSDGHIYQNEDQILNLRPDGNGSTNNIILNSYDECDLNIIDNKVAEINSGVKENVSVEYEVDTVEEGTIINMEGKQCVNICIGGQSAVRENEMEDNSLNISDNCIYTNQSIIIAGENYVFSEEGSSSILNHNNLNDAPGTDNEVIIQNDDEDDDEEVFDPSTDYNVVINEELVHNNEDSNEEVFDPSTDFNVVINEELVHNNEDSNSDKVKEITNEIFNLDDNVGSNVNISLKESLLYDANNEYEEEIDVVNVAPVYVRGNRNCEHLANCHCARIKYFNDVDDEDNSEHADHIYGKSDSKTDRNASLEQDEYDEDDEEKDLNNDENCTGNDEENYDENFEENDGENYAENEEDSENEGNTDNEDEDELVVSMRRENRAADEEIRNIMSNRKRSIVDEVVYNRTDRQDNLPKVLVLKNEEGGHYCKRIGTFKPTYVGGMEYREEFNVRPGCSKDDDYIDSNATIRNMLRSKPRPGGNGQYSPNNDDYSDDSDDSDYSYQCLCDSPHEDDDYCEEDDEELDEREWNRIWRKRKYDGASTPTPPQCKKFCPDGSIASVPADGSLLPSAANITGPSNINQWLNNFLGWSKNEKIQAIDALINCCAASQVRHMMKTIEPLLQRDFISLLPKELALSVLGYLQPKDLLIAAQTCRYWRFLADDNLLWKEQCRRIGIMALKKSTRYIPRCANPWKAAYMKQYLIENNWLHKSVKTPLILRGHDDHVITCLQFYGNRILSGSDDTTLKIWSSVTGKCLRTLVGHAGGVWSSQMVGNMVVSGSTDRTLRVWEANTGKCLNILIGHTSTVRCLHLHQDKVVSGSRDATLRIWSLKDGKCLRVLIGHLAAVRCVQYNGKVVVSGAYDFYVKVWNPDTGECIHTLAGHTNRVYSLQFDGVHIVSGSLDTSIKVWDVESGQLKHTLVGHQSLTSGMELHSNILVSGNADSTVKVWDITTGHCLHTLSGPSKHQSAVTCLQSTNRFVITSSDDGTVKLWDMRTGEFIRNLVELNSGGSGGVVWRIRASATKLICAVGSRNGTEETKLLVLDFDTPGVCRKCEE